MSNTASEIAAEESKHVRRSLDSSVALRSSGVVNPGRRLLSSTIIHFGLSIIHFRSSKREHIDIESSFGL